MKILVIVPSIVKLSGVDYHRLYQPHRRMGELFPDEVNVFIINEIDSPILGEMTQHEFFKQFDLVVANRFISKIGNGPVLIEKLNLANLPYVIDIDDDYRIPEWHVLNGVSSQGKHAQQILDGINKAAAVTTTHEYMVGTIKHESKQKNVYEIPNGIYPEEQFEVKPFYSKRVCFGWSGSVTHFEDVLMLFDSLVPLYTNEDLQDKFRVVYGGYDGNDETSRALAGILTAKGKAKPDNFTIFPATDVKNYARFYDNIHVSLIPLRENRFNKLKSNLKLIEAGFKKKAVICSDVYPYSPMLKHGKNCLVVKKRHDWYNHMVTLIKNPSMIKDLSEQLYEDVQVQHIDIIAKTRLETYKLILKQYHKTDE